MTSTGNSVLRGGESSPKAEKCEKKKRGKNVCGLLIKKFLLKFYLKNNG